jgi:hypothetical protein
MMKSGDEGGANDGRELKYAEVDECTEERCVMLAM